MVQIKFFTSNEAALFKLVSRKLFLSWCMTLSTLATGTIQSRSFKGLAHTNGISETVLKNCTSSCQLALLNKYSIRARDDSWMCFWLPLATLLQKLINSSLVAFILSPSLRKNFSHSKSLVKRSGGKSSSVRNKPNIGLVGSQKSETGRSSPPLSRQGSCWRAAMKFIHLFSSI